MNTPFVVAQANTSSSGTGTRPVRIIKVNKPQGDQALTVQLGYDQSYKLDLSAIANEKITLVHIGEKLIILFDNKSTVTVEPFFDSMNTPLSNVTVEATGRDFTSGEFASAFPITTDQSVLTAAGVAGAPGTPASGADFHGPAVDPLNSPNPLDLLGQEELPNFVINELLGIVPANTTTAPANNPPTIEGELTGVVEEEALNREVILQPSDSGNGNEDENSTSGDDHDTVSNHTITGQAVDVSLASLVTGGSLPLTFSIVNVTADGDAENDFVHDTNGNRVTSFGADVKYVFVDPTLIEGFADGRLVFTLQVVDAANGTFRFTLNDQIDHPAHTVDAGSTSHGASEETLGLDLSSLIGGHDNANNPIALPNANMFTIGVIDDTPVAQIQMFGEGGLVVDETVPSGDEAADPFSYGTPLGVATQTMVFSFGSNPGADGLGSSTHLSLDITGGNGADSGLTATNGTAIHLFLNGAIVEGRVDGSGDVAFALSINDFGQVTVAQYLALHHPDPSNTNESVDLAGKVNAVVSVTDGDGDVATSSVDVGGSISFRDDAPTVTADTNWVKEATNLVATGNMFHDVDHPGAPAGSFADHADIVGADGTAFWSWSTGGVVAGLYGTLTIAGDGSYTYELNNADPAVTALNNGQTLTDTFTYFVHDGDGDEAASTLQFTIFGTDNGVTISNLTPQLQGGDALENEANLSDGSAPNAAALIQNGTFNITASDGLDELTVGGQTVIHDGVFTPTTFLTPLGNSISFTGYNPSNGQVDYTYTLLDNENHPTDDGTNSLYDNLSVVLTDIDGSTANDTLIVNIVDDVPQLAADTNWVKETTNLVATGNMFGDVAHPGAPAGSFADHADIVGADGTAFWSWSAGGVVAGLYGTLTIAGDGGYTYELNNADPTVTALTNGQTLTDTFTYYIHDGDGDEPTSTLQFTIFGTDNGVFIQNLTPQLQGGDALEFEANLANGSAPNAAALIQNGNFNIITPDGLDDLFVGGHQVINNGMFTPTTFLTPLGNSISFTGFNPSNGQVDYTYTLLTNENHPTGNSTNSVFENLSVVLTDVDGSTANDNLIVNIVDDVPTAHNDADSVKEDGPLVADGNVITGVGGSDANANDGVADTAGADGIASIAWSGASGGVVTGTFGTLTVTSFGNYSYSLNNLNPTVQGLANGETLTETFNYTVSDGDGDTSPASLTITINGTSDGVTITNLDPQAQGGDVSVNEDDLLASRGVGESAGSDQSKESTTQTGTFNISAPDGLDDLFVGTHQVINNGTFAATSFTTSLNNTLSITGFDALTGTVSYSYTLLDNETHAPVQGANSLFENFAVTLTDVNGVTANDTLSVNIIDDVPAANAVTKNLVSDGHDTNIMLILDTSGSMGNASGLPGLSRLAVMKAAVTDLLEQYGDIGDVRVQIVQFSSNGSQVGSNWMTIAQAEAAVNALTAGGNTDYDAAVATAQGIYGLAGKLATAGVQNVSYFMSDGVPNENNGTGTNGIVGAEITTWQGFLQTNDINSFALGMGAGATQSTLDPLAYNGLTNTDTNAVIVTDLSQLTSVLVGTVSSTGGNILTDGILPGSFGADGGYVKSITVDLTTYTYDPASGGSITVSGTNHGSFDTTTNTETVTLASGGVLTMVMDNGTYGYTAPANVSSGFTDSIQFLLTDNDGDTAGNTLDITVTVPNQAPSITSDGGGTTASINVNENTTAVTTVTSSDTDGPSATYSIVGGSDAAKFAIDASTGVLSFISAPNFEAPADSNANNSYVVQVQVTDGSLIDSQTITVNVTNVNEAPTATITPLSYSATEQTNLTLHGTGMSIADIDAGTNVISATLSVTAGILTVAAGNSGVDSVSGSGTSSVTVTGTVTEINNLLGGVDTGGGSAGTIVYQANTDTPPASATLTLLVDDTGDTGSGGPLTASDTATINIAAVNDPPNAVNDTVLTNINDPAGTEAISIPLAALLFNDSDPEGATLIVQSVTESDSNFTATLDTPNGEVDVTDQTGGGTFTYTLGTTPAGGTDTANVTINRSQDGETTLDGTSSGEILLGRDGAADTLIGNGGKDYMIGGTGNDTFVFNATGNSGNTSGTADVITDFVHGQDIIELTAIDANTNVGGGGSGGQTFTWGGTSPTANGVWYTEVGPNTIVSMDTNGSTGSVEMMIVLTGIGKNLTAADFHL